MITIPEGKRLRLTVGSEPVASGIPLIIQNPITLSLTSTFSPLLGGGNTKMLNVLGAAFAAVTKGKIAFSGQYEQLGFQQWESTDPLAFSTELNFYMGSTNLNDAKREVYDPMIEISKLVLPEGGGGAGTLIGPGPSVLSVSDKVEYSFRTIVIEIGRVLRINSIIIKKAEPTFSNETDENEYPIWGKLALDINSLSTATVGMLDNRGFEPTIGGGGYTDTMNSLAAKKIVS